MRMKGFVAIEREWILSNGKYGFQKIVVAINGGKMEG